MPREPARAKAGSRPAGSADSGCLRHNPRAPDR